MCPQVRTRAGVRLFPGKTRPPTAFITVDVMRSAAAEPEATFARLYTIDRTLPRRAMQPLAQPTPRIS